MSSLWNELKKAPKRAPTNVVNGDVLVVEETQGGATVVKTDTRAPANAQRPKFKPVDPSTVVPDAPEPEHIPDITSDNYDLVGDDIGNPAPPKQRNGKRPGRTRLYPTNADRQAAYRTRKQQE